MGYRVGVDIGGTFADFCVVDEATGRLETLKVLTTPSDPGAEVVRGIGELERRFGIPASAIDYFTHGTTVGVNSVIQRKGIKLGLIVTRNFVDVLELARLKMPDPYHLLSARPQPLVTRDRVIEVDERMLADGSAELPLEEATARAALAQARALGVEGLVISLLHSYRNAAHERQLKAWFAEWAPDLAVFCSAEIWPIIREYERTSTAVIHGYVQPRVSGYLGALQAALARAGVTAPAMVTKSNGGVMTAELGKTLCVQMLLSGTAAGVIGAGFVARQAGRDRVLSLDIGGTSADLAVVIDGKPSYGVGEVVGEFPIYIPTVAVTSIGEGGGSIAKVDGFGQLVVGPESAGSTPGPACYGRGGTRPTVTDSVAALGWIGHGELGYGAVTVDRAAATAAVQTIAAPLKLSVRQAAEGVIRICVAGMFKEVSKLMSRQGLDPRDFTLLAFGGAGPMLGCFLARELGVRHTLIPATPGVLSALGGLIADVKSDFIKTGYFELKETAAPRLRAIYGELGQQAERWIREEQGFEGPITLSPSADMRYRGQSFEIETVLTLEMIASGDVASASLAFHREHERLYGHSDPKAAIEVINLRMVVTGAVKAPDLPAYPKVEGEPPSRPVKVWMDGAEVEARLYDRADLRHGHRFQTPCVIQQADATTCAPAGFTGTVDQHHNLILTLEVEAP